MGAWGVAIFSDDLAADLKGDFTDLIGDGLSTASAVEKLIVQYRQSINDSDDGPVFWLALAAIQWKLGRLEDRTRREALRVIESGADLRRWGDVSNRRKRATVLARLREQLLSPAPRPKRVPKRIRSANDWVVGEVVGFQLQSGKWTMLRVIGHHSDKGGRFAVCELLDWTGTGAPSAELIGGLPVRRGQSFGGTSQFLFQEPRKKKDQSRVARWGIASKVQQTAGGYTVFVWPHIDRMMKEVFGLE